MYGSVAQVCRATPSGDENARKCHPGVSCRTLGRRKCTEVLPKRVVLYPRATNSVGFVAEESSSSLRHSVLHLWASIMDRSVTQACRAVPSGDENVRKCCLSVPRYTLGRQRSAEVSLKRAALHPRATKRRGIVAQACRAAPPRRRKVWVSLPKSPLHPYVILPCTFRQRKSTEVSPRRAALYPRATKMYESVA